ncbi:hypothetical protein BJY04DRAFT_187745 [Aspergillus karnatakaensis]|uniref:uncharacterized protein n=1 Tax=Aspergillus karnatakaensis TaxID=1810916 RepID=UPI003CCDAABE
MEALWTVQQEGPTFKDNLDFVRSLHFQGIQARQKGIKDAHAETFDWILDDRHSFSRWLEQDKGIFWIHGKPGSGKSTLMKFICREPTTFQRLQKWAAPKKLAIANFFFWRAGTRLQQSRTGLLRSLIFEMVRECPNLLPIAKASIPTPKAGLFDHEGEI